MECDEFFVMNFIIVVYSKFRTKLLAANHLIIWERPKFNAEKKYLKFLLEILRLVKQQIILVLVQNLFSGEGHLHILWTIEALELILGELHISVYPSQGKKVWVELLQLANFC